VMADLALPPEPFEPLDLDTRITSLLAATTTSRSSIPHEGA
jgi:hypothetical protein